VAVYVADNTTINGPNYTTSRDVTRTASRSENPCRSNA
jgi:hypothetical protein